MEWLRKNRPSTLEVTSPDPVTAAAAAVLTGDEVAPHYVELVSRRVGDATLRAERDAAVARAERLESELERLKAERSQLDGAAERVRADAEIELERLR